MLNVQEKMTGLFGNLVTGGQEATIGKKVRQLNATICLKKAEESQEENCNLNEL